MTTSAKPALMMSVFVLVLAGPASCSDLDRNPDVYTICSTDTTTTSPNDPDLYSSETSVDVRSATECAQLCSEREGCGGVSVCPAEGSGQGGGGVVCRMVDKGDNADLLQQHCSLDGHLQPWSRHACYFMLRDADTQSWNGAVTSGDLAPTPPDVQTTATPLEATTQSVCKNGGTFDGTRCWCPLPYAGRNCSRYMRDCTEAVKEQGHSGPHGTYTIQPSNSPSFEVRCSLSGDGTTYPMRKKPTATGDWTGQPWDASARIGFGELNPIPPNSQNFFIGLEKTHQITKQAEYLMNSYMSYNAWADGVSVQYLNFTLGSDSSGFELTYSLYQSFGGLDIDNMLQGDPPVKFSTNDRCYPDCSKTDGWFGANGKGFRMLSYPLVWTIGGVDEPLNYFHLGLTRTSDFYGE